MKNSLFSLLLLSVVVHGQQNATNYNGNCPSCVLANSTFFYCQKTSLCVASYVENQSCEQGMATCLDYYATDLGIKEITPNTKMTSFFNYTIRGGQAAKFAISNQDSRVTGWFKLMYMDAPLITDQLTPTAVSIAEDTTAISDLSSQILNATPSGVKTYYYNQNTNAISPDFVYSWEGKSYLKPLNTRFLFVYSTGSDVTVSVMYGNISNAYGLIVQGFLCLAIALQVLV